MNVAIVIVNYNSAALLERCLASLERQTRQPDRVIVVDNHSDEKASVHLLGQLDGVEVIYMDHNAGYGAAINRAAMTLEPGDLLCCLNPDAFPKPDWLEKLIRAADRHPSYHSFAPLMLNADDPERVDGAGDDLHVSGIPWRRFHGRRVRDHEFRESPVFSACAGAAMYRIDAFREAGGFDEALFMYVEDIDLGFRLQLAGKPCLLVPDAEVYHVGSAITGRRSDFSTYYGHRNLVYQYVKNMPMLLLLLTLPLHLIAHLLTLVLLSARGSTGAILKAKRDALRMLPAAIAERRRVLRRAGTRQIWPMLSKTPSRRLFGH